MAVKVFEGTRNISFRDPYGMRITDPQTESVVRYGRWSLVCLRRIGRGTVVFTSDREFLFDANLESGGSYNIGNVILLKKIIELHERPR